MSCLPHNLDRVRKHAPSAVCSSIPCIEASACTRGCLSWSIRSPLISSTAVRTLCLIYLPSTYTYKTPYAAHIIGCIIPPFPTPPLCMACYALSPSSCHYTVPFLPLSGISPAFDTLSSSHTRGICIWLAEIDYL